MAESRLSLSSDQLKSNIGHYLGYGRGTVAGETVWTTLQTNDINACLRSALSQVYNPPLANGQTHNWSFLRPFVTLVLPANERTVDLPDDFGGFTGQIYISSESPTRPWVIPVTTPERVEVQYSLRPASTGAPQLAAELQSKGGTIDAGTRSKLYVWPLSDGAYTFRFEYYYIPDALTGSTPYPPGGALHAELFHASARAAAERELDDAKGVHWEYFMERLTAAIAADRKRKGTRLGYNGDSSDDRNGRGRNPWWHGYGDTITLSGQTPE